MNYLTNMLRKNTPQTEALPGQIRNSDIGYAWAVDDWTRLDRFLVLGSEGGSFYAGERELTRENAQAVERCILADGERAVDTIVGVHAEGRAPKVDPVLFALALAASVGDEKTRRAALDAVPTLCRTASQLFRFVSFAEGFRGWGRGLRRAVGRWYVERELESLAYQVVKYRQRDGWSHRDLLRLAHPGTKGRNPAVIVPAGHARLFDWVAHGGETAGLPDTIDAFVRAQRTDIAAADAAELVREYRLPREALQPEHLRAPEVWDALLDDMPMTALIRNLATMTRVGAITPGSERTQSVIAQLEDTERLHRARVHPIAILAALRTYASGRSVRGSASWTPVTQVIDALDAAFYAAFGNVESTGQRTLLALDVSSSMTWGDVAGVPGLTPRDASAAMALVTAATEPRHEIVGFTHGLSPLAIGPRQRLDDAIRTVSDLPFGATDCAQPMLWAAKHEREIDTFVIYTDSETWAGNVHPAVALEQYRRASGIDSRLVVVGMVSNGFTIADPNDPGMLDVVGFDAATPELIAGFSKRSF